MGLVTCKKCGADVLDTMSFCPACGEVVGEVKGASKANENRIVSEDVFSSGVKGWIAAAVCSFLLSIVMIGMGIYKYLVYSNPEYGNKTNVYVGGDAYNYIINSNYTTGFYVLATMFALVGIGCIIIYYLTKIDNRMRG